jgi:hypothetical protein
MTDATIAAPPAKVTARWQAAGIHLLISAAIAGVTLFLMLRVWYPPPLFAAEGGNDLLLIIVAVDVIIGPLITLIIFKVSKPSLRFDLTVIALLQLCALAYGVYVMFVARPVFIAMTLSQFETIRANDIEPAELAQTKNPAFRSLPLSGPIYVAIELPQNLKALGEIFSRSTKTGSVVTEMPKYFVPYAEKRQQAIEQSQPLEPAVQRGGDFAAMAQDYLTKSGRKAVALKFMPLQTRRGYGAVLIDAKSGEIVTLLPPKL